MIKVLNLTPYSCEKISKKILIDKEFVKLPRTYYSLCKPRDPEDRARYMSSFDYMNDIAVFIQDIIQASPDVIIAPRIAGGTTYSVMDIFYSFELKFIYSKNFFELDVIENDESWSTNMDTVPIIQEYIISSDEDITPEMCPYSVYSQYTRGESKFTKMIENMNKSYPKILSS